jgi:histidinol-phosphate aminotransferase
MPRSTGVATLTGRAEFVPPVRSIATGAGLVRPDWTLGGNRDPRLLWLDKNENTDPVLQAVVFRVLAEMDPRSVAIYPDAAPLYHKLAEYLGVSPHSLVLAQGSDGVIGSVFRSFVGEGDVVLLTNPTYAMYQVYAGMFGAITAGLEYSAGVDGPMLQPAAVIDQIRTRRPKLVCLPNPDSPTGTVIEPDALRAIVLSAREAGSMMLIDEAYYPFYEHTVVPWVSEFPNLVVARTFSKAWGLTGLRLGYGIASPAVAALLQKFRPNYEVNSVAVAMALRMISEFEPDMRASVARLNAGRDGFLTAMRGMGLRTLESRGSFCHVAFGKFAERIHGSLGDMVLYRQDFNVPCLKGFSRFSSTTRELFDPVIGRIRSLISEGRRSE